MTLCTLSLEDEQEVRALLDLQRASYSVEAHLIGSDAIPPLRDTVEDLRTCGETFVGYMIDGQLAGAISYKRDGVLLDIHRLMVHPRSFRRGIAAQLLAHIEEREQGVERIIVQTGARNVPACSLYQKHGFTTIETIEVQPGLLVTRFEKRTSV